jgi:hypothetical protein
VTATANLLAATTANGLRFVTLETWRSAVPEKSVL